MNKFKVLGLDFYCDFNIYGKRKALKLFQMKDNGPLEYIEECGDMPFPAREGVKYCVRLGGKPKDGHYRPYACYCYQLGRWFKYKKTQYLFNDVYVPQIMSRYDYEKYLAPLKFLSKKAYEDWIFHQREKELESVGRNARKCRVRLLGFTKKKKQKPLLGE